MRNASIIAAAIIIAAGVIYLKPYPHTTSTNSTSQETTAGTKVDNAQLKQLGQAIEQYQSQQQSAIKQLQQEQIHLATLVKQLQKEIHHDQSADNKTSEQAEETLEASQTQISQVQGRAQPTTELDISSKMDQTLFDGHLDAAATDTARAQTAAVLETLPDVNLDDIQCSSGFCRVHFSHSEGGTPDISKVWGHPPFMSQGFTMPQDDGSVLLYFTKNGVSIEDLREDMALLQ